MNPPKYNKDVSPYYSRFSNQAMTMADYSSPLTIYVKKPINKKVWFGFIAILSLTLFIWIA